MAVSNIGSNGKGKSLVFWRTGGPYDDYVLLEVESPKICKQCHHYVSEGNYRYKRCTRLAGTKILNLRTGELEVIPEIPCITERHTTDPTRCGVTGRFWEAKHD